MATNLKTKWIRVSKNRHCPICDKPDWCMIAEDNLAVICARVESDIDAGSKGAGWIHRLSDPRPVFNTPEHQPNVLTFPLASISRRNLAYNYLLSELRLLDSHRDNLQKRGLTDSDIADLGYKTLSSDDRDAITQRLAITLRLAGVPGFYIDNGNVELAGSPGILIPVRDIEYRIQAFQVRCDNINGGKYKWISSAGKDLGCSSGSPIHVSHPEFLTNSEVWITEGALKADISAIKMHRCFLAVAGVGNWHGIISSILDLKPSKIIVAFDMDKRTNEIVQLHCNAMVQALLQTTNEVYEAEWDPQYKGIDDISTNSTFSTSSTILDKFDKSAKFSTIFDLFRQNSTNSRLFD
jgi:Domain of unknown function (DUF3854)